MKLKLMEKESAEETKHQLPSSPLPFLFAGSTRTTPEPSRFSGAGRRSLQQLGSAAGMLRSLKDERYFKKLGKNQNQTSALAPSDARTDTLDNKIAELN